MKFLTAAATEAAAATGNAAIVAAIAPPTSAKLTELKNAGKELAAKLAGLEFDTKDWNDCMTELQGNRKDQAAEIAAIAKGIADEKLAVLRQERTKTIDAYRDAVLVDAKKSTDETKAAVQAAYDVLVNLVLPNHATKAAPSAGTGTGTKGNKTAEILAELTSRINGGMSASDAVKDLLTVQNADGSQKYSRGTVGSVRTEHFPAK